MQSQIDLINAHNEAQDRRMDNFNVRQTNQDSRLNGLEKDVDRIVNASTEDNLEVVQARGSFETLGKRLDASDVKVTDLEAYTHLLDTRLVETESHVSNLEAALTSESGISFKRKVGIEQFNGAGLFEMVGDSTCDWRFRHQGGAFRVDRKLANGSFENVAVFASDGSFQTLQPLKPTGGLYGDVVSHGAVYGIGTRRTTADGHTSRMMASTVSGEVVWGVAPNSNADVTSYIRIGSNKLQFINGTKVENIARTATYDVATLDEDGKTFLDRLIEQVQDQEERLARLEG